MRVPVTGRHVHRLLNHGPTTLVSTAIATEPPSVVGAPLVCGCASCRECRVLLEAAIEQRYDLFVFECVAAWADDALWQDGAWQFADGPRTIHHSHGGRFFATGERHSA